MTDKVHYKQTGSQIVTLRNMKNFNRENYIRDLQQQTWTDVNLSKDPILIKCGPNGKLC